MSNLEEVNSTLYEAGILSDKIKDISKKLKDMPDEERQKLLKTIKQQISSVSTKYNNYAIIFCVSLLVFLFGMSKLCISS